MDAGGATAAGGGAGAAAVSVGGGFDVWARWSGTAGLPHLPRGLHVPHTAGTSPHEPLAALRLALAADKIYDSVDDLARALQAQLATFAPWQRSDPAYKPLVTGFIWTPAGPRRVTLMLDTGATHCFICAQLARLLQLPTSSIPGPTAVSLASPDTTRQLQPPVLVHLTLGGDTPLREVIDMSPLDLGPGIDIILGWDWISSHDLQFLYPTGAIAGGGPQGPVSTTLQPLTHPGTPLAQVLIGHGEFRRMLRRVVPSGLSDATVCTTAAAAPEATSPLPARHGGMSKPLEPLGTAELAAAAHNRQARSARRLGGVLPPPATPRFVDGTELLADGTELHLASLRLVDTSLTLPGMDHPAFTALKAEFADVLGGPPPGLPPDRGIELVLETGTRPMPRTRPIKRLS